MSDDEYYADSPYDEFEEMLWDADPGPNLADDLAQHTAYSPVWQDDPSGELSQYHSDWDYYSDDYFDDDPAILKINPIDGGPPQSLSSENTQSKRGRKRKVAETFDTPDRLENKFLVSTIQGTVWAQNAPLSVKVFRGGQNDRVALLTDWRERFHMSNKRHSPGLERRLERDESWANNLGLADMGLTRVRERKGTQQETTQEDDAADETEEENVYQDEVLTDDEASLVHEEETEIPLCQGVRTTGSTAAAIPSNGGSSDKESATASHSRDQRAQKRRKVSRSSLQSRTPDESEKDDDMLSHGYTSNTERREPLKRAGEGGADLETAGRPAQRSNQTSQKPADQTTGKKRRLSASSEAQSSATGSTESRAKRVALSKTPSSHAAGIVEKPPSANTRSARKRKG